MNFDEIDRTVQFMRERGLARLEVGGISITLDPTWRPSVESEARAETEEDVKRQERAEKLKPFRHVRLT